MDIIQNIKGKTIENICGICICLFATNSNPTAKYHSVWGLDFEKDSLPKYILETHFGIHVLKKISVWRFVYPTNELQTYIIFYKSTLNYQKEASNVCNNSSSDSTGCITFPWQCVEYVQFSCFTLSWNH